MNHVLVAIYRREGRDQVVPIGRSCVQSWYTDSTWCLFVVTSEGTTYALS